MGQAVRERLIVVGNGMAGLRLVDEVIKRCPQRFMITVIGAEPEPAYNRVLLSTLLAGEIGAADVALKSRSWYAANRITLITGESVRVVDPCRKCVYLGSGQALSFDRLVLATGSEPFRLPISGCDLDGVIAFRTMADVERMRVSTGRARPAVVIGGGLLGIEAAYGLARAGVPVTLIHLMDRLMERQLDSEAARRLKAALEGRGIAVKLDAKTEMIEGSRWVDGVRLSDGTLVPCSAVVMAAGIVPNSALAKHAGLETGRGVKVDDQLRTSVPEVYALGECAEHRGICYGLVEPAYDQARILSAVLVGEVASYQGSVLATNLKVSGVPVFSVGDFEGQGAEKIVLNDEGTHAYRKLVIRDDRLVGAVLFGDTGDALWYRDLIASGASIKAVRPQLSFGRAYAEAA